MYSKGVRGKSWQIDGADSLESVLKEMVLHGDRTFEMSIEKGVWAIHFLISTVGQ